MKDAGLPAGLLVDDNVVASQQPVVAVLVRDDFNGRINIGITLDEPTNSRRQARGKTTSSEQSYSTNRHGTNTFQTMKTERL